MGMIRTSHSPTCIPSAGHLMRVAHASVTGCLILIVGCGETTPPPSGPVRVERGISQPDTPNDPGPVQDTASREAVQPGAPIPAGPWTTPLEFGRFAAKLHSDPADKATILTTLANVVIRSGDEENGQAVLAQAREVVNDISSPQSRVILLTLVGGALLALDREEQAVEPLNAAVEVVQSEGDESTEVAVMTLVGPLGKAGRADDALGLINNLTRPYLKTQALHSLAVGLAKAENGPGALQVAEKVSDSGRKAVCFAVVSRMLSDSGHRDFAEPALKQALAAVEEIGENLTHNAAARERERSNAMQYVVLAQAASGDLDQALNAARSIESPTALRTIASGLARMGQLQMAVTIADAIHDPAHRIATLCRLASHSEEASRLSLLQQSLELAGSIELVKTKAQALGNIGEVLAAVDELELRTLREQFSEQLQSVKTEARALEPGPQTERTLSAIVTAFGKAGDGAGVVELAQKLDGQMHDTALRQAAYSLQNNGQFEEALDAVEQMSVGQIKRSFLRTLVVELLKETTPDDDDSLVPASRIIGQFNASQQRNARRLCDMIATAP